MKSACFVHVRNTRWFALCLPKYTKGNKILNITPHANGIIAYLTHTLKLFNEGVFYNKKDCNNCGDQTLK